MIIRFGFDLTAPGLLTIHYSATSIEYMEIIYKRLTISNSAIFGFNYNLGSILRLS